MYVQILILQDGRLFHIDYSFLFGNDPKALIKQPPFRLPQEIITALGGTGKSLVLYLKYNKVITYCVILCVLTVVLAVATATVIAVKQQGYS
jgi:hypothetical protein